jgi:hypothetical protein
MFMLNASVAPIATNVGPINPASCFVFIAALPLHPVGVKRCPSGARSALEALI